MSKASGRRGGDGRTKRERTAGGRRTSTRAGVASGKRLSAIGAILVILLAGVFVWNAYVLQFTQDDAFISLRYARNLVEGHGLVFNPGERVEGYSNFTWTLLLALFLKLGAPAVAASRWLGIAFGVLAILAAARLARSLEGRWGVASVGTAALLAGNCAFALWSTGGLETALYTFLVTAGLERGLAPDVGRRGRLLAPALLSLAALSRPDGPLVFVLWFAIRAFDSWRTATANATANGAQASGAVRDRLVELAIFVGPLIPYAIWKVAYYGDLLPNTYYAKAGLSAVYVSRGFDYALDWLRAYGGFGFATAMALLSLVRERWGGVEARLLAIWIGVAAYIIVIGGDVLYLHRFWLPILPIGAVLAARGTTWLAGRILGHRPFASATAAFVILAVLVVSDFQRNADETMERKRQEGGFVMKMEQTGEWLRKKLPPDAKIATTTIGAIAYSSGLHVIDMLGLTDREVARNPKMFDGLEDTWREIKYNAESVLRREPDAIFFSTDVRPSSAAERALYLYESFHESYYPYYYRTRPWRRQAQTMHLRRADAPPFRTDLVEVDGFRFLDEYINGHVEKGRNKDNEAALAHFRRSTELGPESFQAGREWAAVTLYDLKGGEAPEALEALADVVSENPFSTVARGRLVVSYLQSGKLDAAEMLLRRHVEINPDDSLVWSSLAEVERQRGNFDEAYEHILRAIEIWAMNAANMLLLGQISLQRGDLEMARRGFNSAIELNAGGDIASAARRGLQIIELVESGEIRMEDLLKAQSGG